MPSIPLPLGKHSLQYQKLLNAIQKNEATLEVKLASVSTALKSKAITASEALLLEVAALKAVKNGAEKYANLILALQAAQKALTSRTKTPAQSPAIQGYIYVEMGDGLKWATCNIGASKPEEHGDFFIWGETEPCYSSFDPLTWKDGQMYAFETSKYFTHESPIIATKYNLTDNKRVLDAEDDAAKVNWGGSWRMPTAKEFEKLLDQNLFSWEKTTVNGVEGYTVTSKVKGFEGNNIFLPYSKHFKGRSLTNFFNIDVAYWSSDFADIPSNAEADTNANRYCEYAKALEFSCGDRMMVTSQTRCWGFPIRPVSD